MGSIRKWIRKKLDSDPQKGEPLQQELPPLPFLPTTRSRPLIPPQSEDQLANYGLFGILPLELRRRILIEAFGGQTLHMDLSYRHPLVRTPTRGPEGSAMHRPRHCDWESKLVADTSQPEQWQWFSCVCHRRAGYSEAEKEQGLPAMEGSLTVEPCDDECLEGSKSMCRCPQGTGGVACFVQVMGWLLSCRQA